MTKMPKQFYIFVIVLLLYFWPWQLFSGDSPESWILSVTIMQIAFVILCNSFVKEGWMDLIIIVEAACMIINATLFWFSPLVSDWHGQAMFIAFIIELLIITISLQGELVGDTSRPQFFGRNLSNSGFNLRASHCGGTHS